MQGTDATGPYEGRLKRALSPPAFFLGVAFGFAACCIAGRQAATTLAFRDFQRLHRFLGAETLYYPTALQVRTLARQQLPPEKIAVIVGGSSVFAGIGQSVDQLWTRKLQQELGDDFRVLNLAVAGGAANEYGQLTAEMLHASHPKIIHLCDIPMYHYSSYPDGTRDVYRYFFHDARARNLLLPCPERDATLAALEPQRRASDNYGELMLQTHANRWLSFNDLWHVIGYEYFFTVWMEVRRGQFWHPRKSRTDTAAKPERFQVTWQREKEMIEDPVRPYDSADWLKFEMGVKQAVPEPLRPRTIAVVTRFDPARIDRCEREAPGFRARYDAKMQQVLAHLRSCNLHAVEGCTTLASADYMDRNHLLASGGAKLAAELAPVIREQARRLGYLRPETSATDP
jgi:hypothetical protein